MLAALNALLAEMREERKQAEASGNVVDAQHDRRPPNPTYGPKRTPRSPKITWPGEVVAALDARDGVRARGAHADPAGALRHAAGKKPLTLSA